MVFEDSDLTVMSTDKERNYDAESIYFKSCNYVFYHHYWVFPEENSDLDKFLDWTSTDAYIDTPHSLLLVQLINGEPFTGSDDQMVKALFILKEKQFSSNQQMSKNSVFRLIEAITGYQINRKTDASEGHKE